MPFGQHGLQHYRLLEVLPDVLFEAFSEVKAIIVIERVLRLYREIVP